MSIYKIIRNLSVAVLLTTSISFAMEDEGKNSGDVNKARLRELSAFNGMPLLTMENTDGLPLLSSGGVDHAALAALLASTSMAGSDPVVSTRLAFEETSEQTIARTTVPVSFIDDLLKATNGYVEREDLDDSESTSDQAMHIVTYLVNRINTLYENNARERGFANTGPTYTQAQVDAMFAKHADSASYDGLPLLSCSGLDHADLAALFVARQDSAASGDVDALLHSTDEA